MEWSEYLTQRIKHVESLGVKVLLSPVEYKTIEGNFPCRGYFCSETKELFVAGLAEGWKEVFIHETCHVDQWAEGDWLWDAASGDLAIAFDKYLEGEIDMSPDDLDLAAKICGALELDCDSRAVQEMENNDLPFDISEYIQKSNAYYLQYPLMAALGRAHKPGKAPSQVKEVYSCLPKTFIVEQDIPPDFLIKALRCCY